MLIEISKSLLVKQVYKQSTPQKANSKHNFYSILENLAKYIVPQLTQINLLFEEYTPHDQIHMESLFRIADELLGKNIIENLNGCEACLLACAIYGHDWGMAVSEDEKEIILTGNIPLGRKIEEFALLEDEKTTWKNYAILKKINFNEDGYIKQKTDITIDIWRDYVRETHPQRARSRIIHFFSREDLTFAKSLGEICAAHWYSIVQISNLSKNKLILDQTVNMRAISVYIRFIDLLDIGKNRTPYSLWKFINPKNLFSANEWKKHSSLEPVSFKHKGSLEKSNSDLEIIIQGSTNNHIVYSSLKDMRNWIETQIKENEQTLKQLDGYSLGNIKVEWEIESEGFEPIDIRFEFDRSKMFDLIGGEIYNGDPYVFLRELLQNSIDATKIRELQYKEKGNNIDLQNLAIKINVSHEKNGNSQIVFTDSGIGMNLNVVKNYLSVIGKSYYRSEDFNNLDIKLNPISRFGVGLISCFEIADTICIKTKLDNFIYGETDEIKLDIQHYNNQFRVEILSKNSLNIGTSILIEVLGEKWQKDSFKDLSNLKITEYIKAIAGFVPYPILVNEQDISTLILSSDLDDSKTELIAKHFPNSLIWKDSLNLTLKNSVIFEDLTNAHQIYDEKNNLFFMNIDENYLTGSFSYFIPNKNLIGIQRNVEGSQNGITAFLKINNVLTRVPIRYKLKNKIIQSEGDSKSSKRLNFNRLYLNGILVPDVNESILSYNSAYTPPSQTIININSSKGKEITTDLSRTQIRNAEKILTEIFDPLFKNEFQTLFQEIENELKNSSLLHRIFLLSKINLYFPKATLYLSQFYSFNNWPIPFISKTGKIELEEFLNLPEEIEVLPIKFMQDRKNINESWTMENYFHKSFPDVTNLFSSTSNNIYIKDFGFEYDDGSPMNWNSISDLITYQALSKNYKLKSIRISELNGHAYLIENWIKGQAAEKKESNIHLYSISFLEFDERSNNIFCVLPLANSQIQQDSAGDMIFNLNHPMTKILNNALNIYNENVLTLEESIKEKLNTAFSLNPLIGYSINNYSGDSVQTKIGKWAVNFCSLLEKMNLISFSIEEELILQKPLKIITCFK